MSVAGAFCSSPVYGGGAGEADGRGASIPPSALRATSPASGGRKWRIPLVCIMIIAFFAGPHARAVEPDEMLADAALEIRAQKLDTQLRCVVCQSQSLAESNAPLAKDMRIVLRERIADGASDEEAIAFLVDRYGEYVLLRPRLEGKTIVLWTFPLLIVIAGATLAFFYLRARRAAPAPAALDAADEARLKQILDERA